MILLSKVTEDQITDNLKKRINADLMFTYIGPTLVAINPYKKLPYFTEKEITQYRGAQAYEHPPHVYALADRMYQNMVFDNENQCVIISGESGAGKTEEAKLIMNYIAAVSGKGDANTNVVEDVKRIILESNPLLESFGNAKTLRNNNSSRFGKYFEVNFSRSGAPIGGKVSNFLLEKSRVVQPGPGERNYHIFYQLTTAATPQEKQELGISRPQDFHYLNVSNAYTADGINDAQEYLDMKNSMKVCMISPSDQKSILQIVAGILHLGNIDFIEEGNDAIISDKNALRAPAALLSISVEDLEKKLTSRMMSTGGRRGSTYDVTMNVQQAQGTRDALAKSLYSRLFDWIVQSVNNAMSTLSQGLNKSEGKLSLGVLDIFGFEIFERNGFEQFCINYVNERLQQIFIELTLKSEQEEYVNEGIKWTPIDFFNNKIVVDLIESKKPPGIMAILDDICFTMHAVTDGADTTFVQKLDMACSQNRHYTGGREQFVIQHYAGSVTYSSDGFVESNKDTLFKDLVYLIQSSSNSFIRNLFSEVVDEGNKKRPTTVSFKIKNQCDELVNTLMSCVPSYVRCIKPNETKKPKDWDTKRVEHQVRYLNLAENIRVRRAGFCFRSPFDKFLYRFGILTPETFPTWSGSQKDAIAHIMNSYNIDQSEYQFGTSKVFIKSPESLFMIEEQRERRYHDYAKIIQRAWRRYISRKHYLELRSRAADIMYGKKERKRMSLNREFIGDYINYLDNPILKKLVGIHEKVFFADQVTKYDRKWRPTTYELVLTKSDVILIGLEKQKDGPNKGKFIKVIKRKISLNAISTISLSTKKDDFFVIHVPNEYDIVLENILKTEFIITLQEQYNFATGQTLKLDFIDSIRYSIKKTTFQRGGTRTLHFVENSSVSQPIAATKNDITTIGCPLGLPKDSKPNIVRAPVYTTSTSTARPVQNQNISRVSGAAFGGRTSVSRASVTRSPVSGSGRASPMKVATTSQPTSNIADLISKKKAPPPPPTKKLAQCKALYNYDSTEADELSIKIGNVITIVSKDDEGWWTGMLDGRKGLFPANYVELIK